MICILAYKFSITIECDMTVDFWSNGVVFYWKILMKNHSIYEENLMISFTYPACYIWLNERTLLIYLMTLSSWVDTLDSCNMIHKSSGLWWLLCFQKWKFVKRAIYHQLRITKFTFRKFKGWIYWRPDNFKRFNWLLFRIRVQPSIRCIDCLTVCFRI